MNQVTMKCKKYNQKIMQSYNIKEKTLMIIVKKNEKNINKKNN